MEWVNREDSVACRHRHYVSRRVGTTIMVGVLLVRGTSFYNTNIEFPKLNKLKVITSLYHLKMKLSIKPVVSDVQGEHILVGECYVQEVKRVGGKLCTTNTRGLSRSPILPLLKLTDRLIETKRGSELKQGIAAKP